MATLSLSEYAAYAVEEAEEIMQAKQAQKPKGVTPAKLAKILGTTTEVAGAVLRLCRNPGMRYWSGNVATGWDSMWLVARAKINHDRWYVKYLHMDTGGHFLIFYNMEPSTNPPALTPKFESKDQIKEFISAAQRP